MINEQKEKENNKNEEQEAETNMEDKESMPARTTKTRQSEKKNKRKKRDHGEPVCCGRCEDAAVFKRQQVLVAVAGRWVVRCVGEPLMPALQPRSALDWNRTALPGV